MAPTQPHRSLPAAMIDTIRDGVGDAALRRDGTKAVWGALVKTAMSAMQRGWGFAEWASTVSEAGSTLGHQARRDHRKHAIGQRRYERDLRRAWGAAERSVAESPALTADEARQALHEVAADLDALPDAAWPLRPRDRAVLAWVLAEGARRGMTRPATPARAIEAATNVPRAEVSRALARLRQGGWIELHSRGRAGEGGSGKASLHTIRPAAVARLLRDAGAAHKPVPPSGAYVPNGAPTPHLCPNPDPAGVSQTSHLCPNPEEPPMITLTLDPSGTLTATVPREPGDLEAVLDRLRAAGVAVEEPKDAPAPEPETPAAPAPVVSLDGRRAAAGGAR